MAEKVEKIPEEIFVTLREQPIWEYCAEDRTSKIIGYEPILGFAHPHNPGTKGDEKKKKTQLDWAYNDIVEQLPPTSTEPHAYRRREVTNRYFDKDGLLHLVGTDQERIYKAMGVAIYSTPPKIIMHPDFDVIVPQHLQPRVIKNEPIYGFQIQRSVSRYSTSNKVWRVLDPRGFELEISTANFEDIVMNGTIHEGTIEGKCQWHGKKLVMVNA